LDLTEDVLESGARMGFRSYGVVSVMVRFGSGWFGVAALLVATSASAEITRARAAISAVPKRGATPGAFVPKGWSVEVTVEADLDADQNPDRVLVLLEDGPEDDRERAALVLLKRGSGYVLGGSNVGLLPCFGCSGAKGGDGTPSLEVRKGVLLVDQIAGSREFTARLSRFRWHKTRRVFELIGEDIHSGDAVTGASTSLSCNFLTRECDETVSPPQVDEEGREISAVDTARSWKLPKKPLLSLEQLEQLEQ
jgi:hypothetical protein